MTPIAVPEPQPPTPVKQESKLFPPDSGVDTNTSVIYPTAPVESLLSESEPSASETTVNTTTNKAPAKRSTEYNIEITVSDPTKVGEVGFNLP